MSQQRQKQKKEARFPVLWRHVSSVLLAAGFCFSFMPLALAHTGSQDGGFFSGFVHPILGWDHVAAMVAVGLWGAVLEKPAIWVLPIAFPLMMVVGAIAGLAGLPLPFVEIAIALSALVLGGLILFYVKMPLPAAMMIVGIFAVFHGYAHGAELPHSASPVAFAGGFVLATGILHLCGIGLGLAQKLPRGDWLVRGGGGVIALAGLFFLSGALQP